jgi:UPF0271 protein
MQRPTEGARRPRVVDLNADLGEEVTDDAALLEVVTSANVACGFHAGNADVMRAVCERAARREVRVGAQVSYLDREGFGRRPVSVPVPTLTGQVAEQVGTLDEIARGCGTTVSYVKPHGALYNRVVDDDDHAGAVLAGSGTLPVLGLPGARILALAVAAGREVWFEGFPDRGYEDHPDGGRRLLPRDRLGALIHDPAEIARRAVAMAEGVDSICVHGDGPTAVEAARAVRAALLSAGFVVEPFT